MIRTPVPVASVAAAVGVAIGISGLIVAVARLAAPLSADADTLGELAGPAWSACTLAFAAAFILRRTWTTLTLLLALCALTLACGLSLPKSEPASPGSAALRVYFVNLNNENGRIDEIARSIREARPEVVAIAEYSDLHARASDRLFAGLPYRLTGRPNPHFPWRPRAFIASRYPLSPLRDAYGGSYQNLAATIASPAGPTRVVLIHLTRPWPFRPRGELEAQLNTLARRVEAAGPARLLLVGDFNATAGSARMRRFSRRTGLKPARAVIGDWPAMLAAPFRIAIENGFTRGGLSIRTRTLGRSNGSDHRPVVVEVVTR